jgi:glucokinase
LVEQIANYIGLGLVTIMMLYLPDCILLGGGVARSYPLMKKIIEDVINRHNVIIPANQVEIKFAELGQQSGLFGAVRSAQLLIG